MSGGNGTTRARDADRDRVVDALGQAFVDGQLSETDRELRVSRALSARTLDDLDVLVRDLQGHDLVPRPPKRVSKGPFLAIATGLVVVVAIGVLVLRGGDEPDRAPAPAPAPAAPVAMPEVAEPVEFVPEALSMAWFEAFLNGYEEEFGDTVILDAGFRQGGYVHFKRPLSKKRPDLLQDWDWYPDRGFEQSIISASRDPFGYARADLSAIDLDRLLAEIDHSREFLGVDSPDIDVYVAPHIGDSPQKVMIQASNSYGDTGRREITFDGRVLDSQPFVIGYQ
ncbi:hypothetical protein ASG90_03300 [Nocardioides sp. Soil797]|nr:hypothetical protein ASG90_03300 [Nocardioides sp. Soil797]